MPCAAAVFRLTSHDSISPTDMNTSRENTNMVPRVFDFTNISSVQMLDKQLEDQSMYIQSLGHDDSLFEQFAQDTSLKITSWPVVSATNGDRVAVSIFQPADERSAQTFAYVVRSNMHRLGPKWALQVFYGEESERVNLSRALGDPANVIWTPIVLGGSRKTSISYNECRWFRSSMDFWDQISEAHEHVLIFESDSLLLKGNGCVDQFLWYDYVGAPWEKGIGWNPPPFGGNGGLVLTRRSSRIAVTKSDLVQQKLKVEPKYFSVNEDLLVVTAMAIMKMNFPPREVAACFSIETYWSHCHTSSGMVVAPCGTHRVWSYFGAAEARGLLESADF